MRDHLVLYINGVRHAVAGPAAFATLSDYLRYELGSTGTKIVCEEGDCGACTVLVGRPVAGRLRYRSVNSCIQTLLQLDGTHVVTVEGLKQDGRLSPIQEAMVEAHGAQCGFCTPGFVVAMHGVVEQKHFAAATLTGSPRESDNGRLAERTWRDGLTGNLCRCTGYEPILAACSRVQKDQVMALAKQYEDSSIARDLQNAVVESFALETLRDGAGLRAFGPTSIAEAIACREKYPAARVVAGATDLGVQINKQRVEPAEFLSLTNIPELERLEVESDSIYIGATAVWSDIESIAARSAPEFAKILALFASPQIKNVGTLVGNIVNGSPIADSLPFLYVMDAMLELSGPSGQRQVNINSFFRGYKDLDLHPAELVVGVRVPLISSAETLKLYKVSRRRDLDISAFTAAIRVQVDSGKIVSAAVAYGGVGPVILRLRAVEEFLVGRKPDEQTFAEAGRRARSEITPISDVRGSAEFRFELAENIMLRFYEETQNLARA